MRHRFVTGALSAVAILWATAASGQGVVDVSPVTAETIVARLSARLDQLQSRLDRFVPPTAARVHLDVAAPIGSDDPAARLFFVGGWGWACGDVASPQILIDGLEAGAATRRVLREDVEMAFRGACELPYVVPFMSGIEALVDLRAWPAGAHTIALRVYDTEGRYVSTKPVEVNIAAPTPFRLAAPRR